MSFERSKHVRYWRMCSNILPDHYISGDASRMFLGFFIVAAFDILGEPIKEADRQGWISWVYSCQCPAGGFRGFTGTDLRQKRTEQNHYWDPANLPNTFFALATLLVLGDDFEQVKRDECLKWLPRLQREDGSFGEILSFNDSIEGGRDLRYCCCAAGIAYILHDRNRPTYQAVFDEDRLIDYIESCRNYNGGFGESPMREPHSGLNYCAIATLGFLQRLGGPAGERAGRLLLESKDCIRWLVQRHTSWLEEEEQTHEENSTAREENEAEESEHKQQCDPSTLGTIPDVVGFNGRDNKVADTCYCFWNAGALAMLKSLDFVSQDAVRRYLLEKTQHMIGGFGKCPAAPPDVLHSYLGLAALSLFEESAIKSIDPMLCISEDAASGLERIRWHTAVQT